jgi:autotransporter-associated beta strand protein
LKFGQRIKIINEKNRIIRQKDKQTCLCTGLIAVISSLAYAQEMPLVTSSSYTWTGAVDGNWANANNWNPASIPGSSYDIVTFDGTSQNNTIILTGGSYTISQMHFTASAQPFTFQITNGDFLTLNGSNATSNLSPYPVNFIIGTGATSELVEWESLDNFNFTVNHTGVLGLHTNISVTNSTATINSAGFLSVGARVTGNLAVVLNGGNLLVNEMTMGSLSGTGSAAGGVFNIGTLNAATTFNGVMSDYTTTQSIGSVNIIGGALTLNGVNTYTGATSVSTGTLQIGDATHTTASINSSAGNLAVSAGATLAVYGHTYNAGQSNTLTNAGTVSFWGNASSAALTNFVSNTGTLDISPATAASTISIAAINGSGNVNLGSSGSTLSIGSGSSSIGGVISGTNGNLAYAGGASW